MKRRFKRIRIFLVLAISFSILTSSAYLCYYTVAAADFLSPSLNFETFDQEFLSVACNDLKAFLPDSLLNGLYLINYYLEPSPHLFPKTPSLDQGTLILRC